MAMITLPVDDGGFYWLVEKYGKVRKISQIECRQRPYHQESA
jgi:hypothetical protein